MVKDIRITERKVADVMERVAKDNGDVQRLNPTAFRQMVRLFVETHGYWFQEDAPEIAGLINRVLSDQRVDGRPLEKDVFTKTVRMQMERLLKDIQGRDLTKAN